MFGLKKKQQREITRLAEYLISGGAYFWSGYVLFSLLWSVLDWSLWWAKLTANIFGWTVNYLLQRYWVFKNPALAKHKTEVTGRYIFITLVDFVLDYIIVASLKGIGITPYIGQFISSGFFTVWNYFWYKFWVFPEKFSGQKRPKVTPGRLVAHRAQGQSAYQRLRKA
jgi:putative flippase GtrA